MSPRCFGELNAARIILDVELLKEMFIVNESSMLAYFVEWILRGFSVLIRSFVVASDFLNVLAKKLCLFDLLLYIFVVDAGFALLRVIQLNRRRHSLSADDTACFQGRRLDQGRGTIIVFDWRPPLVHFEIN